MRKNKGQFYIIGVMFLLIIMVATAAAIYTTARYFVQPEVNILEAIDSVNFSLKSILNHRLGIYSSVLQATGNNTYANEKANELWRAEAEYIGGTYVRWGLRQISTIEYNSSTVWFQNDSWTSMSMSVEYALFENTKISYEAAPSLRVGVSVDGSKLTITVTKEGKPLLTLDSENFAFSRYNYAENKWEFVSPSTEPLGYPNGSYVVELPPGVDPRLFLVRVTDKRGITCIGANTNSFSLNFDWPAIYSNLSMNDYLTVEYLGNGSIRLNGENSSMLPQPKLIPPLAVRQLHLNQTIGGINQETPFQVETWAADYKIPLGITGNSTVVSGGNIIVFRANRLTSKVTLWWNGSADAEQTPYAYTNTYFSDNVSNSLLNNGLTQLRFNNTGSTLVVTSTVGTISTSTTFTRINSNQSMFGSNPAYIIYNGVVRDIVTAEAEWHNGITGCPDVLSFIYFMFPANTTYYITSTRFTMLTTQQARTITNFCTSNTTGTVGTAALKVEDGVSSGYPIIASATSFYYNSTNWQHHFAEWINSQNQGYGVMLSTVGLSNLYAFDSFGGKTGGINATRNVEILPVGLASVSTQAPYEFVFTTFVVVFDAGYLPIYPNTGTAGLWVIAEYWPTITT
jgi:hypothetical protein